MTKKVFILKNDRGEIVRAGNMAALYDFLIAGDNYKTSTFYTVCDFNSEPVKTIISRQ